MYTHIFSVLLLLLLLTACQHSAESGHAEINYIHNIIKHAHEERPIETLVYVNRRQDINCRLNEIKSVDIATLRMDGKTLISVKGLYNRQALAVVCISELADVLLLSTLAQSFDRMRDSRIIILLQTMTSDLQDFLHLFSEKAKKYNFINLIVLHSTSEVTDPLIAYRLQPFPSATFESIGDINGKKIFSNTGISFNNKTATYFPDLIAPSSLLVTNPRTGEQKLGGSSDMFTMEFAKKYNIQLQWLIPLNEVASIDFGDVIKLTRKGLIDLPTRPYVHRLNALPVNLEYEGLSDVNILVFVPCAKQMKAGDVYKGMRTYIRIVLIAYPLFALLEALTAVSTFRITGIQNFTTSDLIVNLRTFAGVLGISTTSRRFTSISLRQIVIITSVFSLVFKTFFDANLNTLLTKHPYYREINNFQELRDSGIPVIIDRSLKTLVSKGLTAENYISNPKYVSTRERHRLIISFNSSYAYLAPSYLWNLVNYHQTSHNRIVFCRPPALHFFTVTRFKSVLKRNSVFSRAYSDFIKDIHSFGIDIYWERLAAQRMMSAAFFSDNITLQEDFNFTPLTFNDLKWVWKLLGACYMVSGFMLIAEISIAHWQKKKAKNNGIIEQFVV